MTDTNTLRTTTEGTWALPLLTLAPLAAIRIVTALSTPWLVISWILWAISTILVVTAWVAVFRHGTRTPGAWGMCILVHAILAWQLIALVSQ